jgi:hypothetical protein
VREILISAYITKQRSLEIEITFIKHKIFAPGNREPFAAKQFVMSDLARANRNQYISKVYEKYMF